MDKSTKIEILKIIGMIIILIALIWGIVWMNSETASKEENDTIANETETSVEENIDENETENNETETSVEESIDENETEN